METKLNYTLVGLFVILLGGGLLATLLWLTVGGAEQKHYDRYKVYFTESVAGLNPGAPVKYRGVEVGRVNTIKLDPENPEQVEILLDIERGIPIRQDTIAILTIQGLTGLASVELTGGTRYSLPLQAGSDESPPVIMSGPSLVTRLDNALDNVLSNFNRLSAQLGNLLSDANQAAVNESLGNLNTISSAVANRSASIERTLANLETITTTVAKRSASLDKGLENAARVSSELSAIVNRINASFSAVEEAARTITKAGKGLDNAVQENRQSLQRISSATVPQINTLLNELQQLTQTIERLGGELERNPQILVFGRQPGRPGPGE